MFVTVSNHRLPVVVEMNVTTDEGEPTYELFRPAKPDIVLDISTPASQRMYFLLHAIGHAYDNFVARADPSDEEGRQNRLATINRQLASDLSAQGGEIVLHRLFGDNEIPEESQIAGDMLYSNAGSDEADWPTEVCCWICRTIYPDSAVRNGKPYFDPKANGFAMNRVLNCGACERELRWTTRCSPEGTPWPVVLVAPTAKSLIAISQ